MTRRSEKMMRRRKKVSFTDCISLRDRTMSIEQGLEEDLMRRTVVTQIWWQEERRTKGGCALTTAA